MTYSTWTGAKVRAIRDSLGLSAAKFAAELGLAKNGGRTVQRWESGEIRITLRTQRQIEALERMHERGYVFVGRGSVTSAALIKDE